MTPAASTPSTESLFRLGLNDALPISDEATTSRVVVNNEILRTVIFTFDTGQLLTGRWSSPSWRARWTSPSVNAPSGWAPGMSSTWPPVSVTR